MKFKFKPNIVDNPVWSEDHVEIKTSIEESNALREALKTIQRYKDIAIKAYESHYKHNPERDSKDPSHWCEFDYCVKNDKVTVVVRNGMVG